MRAFRLCGLCVCLTWFVLMHAPGADAASAEKSRPAVTTIPGNVPLPVPQGVRVERDLEYARVEDRPLRLDVYRSEIQSGACPLVVWVHGGGWAQGSKENCPAAWLANHGYVVASIQYRLTDVAKWPAQIDDCRAAIRWLRSNAERFEINPERIGAWGSSAGGHLVSMLGLMDLPPGELVSSRVNAVCDYFGPSDLLSQPTNIPGPGKTDADLAKSNAAKLLGGILRDIPDKAKAASPLYHVSPGDVPFLIVHGSKDERVPLDQSERLHAKLEKAGVPVELYVVEGAGHGGTSFQKGPVRAKVQQFFDRHLKDVAR